MSENKFKDDTARSSENSKTLGVAYTCSSWTKRKLSRKEIIGDFLKRSDEESAKFVAELGPSQAQLNVEYGSEEREKVDIFSPVGADKGKFIYIGVYLLIKQ
ncbi:uncharacterized protein LOC115929212 [Strongylocentrotus purpuratus]|uniref:Uncharacterized protein n=1 Tax=Strongylocentrotus purpuratus TaxID=7668 RepID=A0A7M7T4N3_STRPU|nr:uncharacterized protein LOC115929212 [Strongylocentrotus purpuratus]